MVKCGVCALDIIPLCILMPSVSFPLAFLSKHLPQSLKSSSSLSGIIKKRKKMREKEKQLPNSLSSCRYHYVSPLFPLATFLREMVNVSSFPFITSILTHKLQSGFITCPITEGSNPDITNTLASPNQIIPFSFSFHF